MSQGAGITFVDLDETLFHTHARVLVRKDGEQVRALTNKEFNTYRLGPKESFDFSEFTDARLFRDTSEPVEKVVGRVRRMARRIRETSSRSRIIILTARKDLDDRDTFLEALRAQGLPVEDKDLIYVERTGNKGEGSVAERKHAVMRSYLRAGDYRRCRLIDDDPANLEAFRALANAPEARGVEFFGLLVLGDGTLRRVV